MSFFYLFDASMYNICFFIIMVQEKQKFAECLSKNILLERTLTELNKDKLQTLEELIQVIDCVSFFLI